MSFDSLILQFFSFLLPQALPLAVAMVGLVLSLVRWRTAPAVSRWVLAASLLSLLAGLGAPVTYALTPPLADRYGFPFSQVRIYYAVIGFIWATVHAASAAALLVAAYVGRGAITVASGREVIFPPPPPAFPPGLDR